MAEKKKKRTENFEVRKLSEFKPAVELSDRKAPAIRTSESRAARKIERTEKQRVELGADRKVLESLHARYGRWIRPEQLSAARKDAARFEEPGEFVDRLHQADRGLSEKELQRIDGFAEGGAAHVKRSPREYGTLVHERLHTLSHPRAREVLGRHLYEGLTEKLAVRESGIGDRLSEWEKQANGRYRVSVVECYPKEKATVEMISARVPESALMEAYFQGNERKLRSFIDRDCGEGAFDRVRDLLQQEDDRRDESNVTEALKIIKKGR